MNVLSPLFPQLGKRTSLNLGRVFACITGDVFRQRSVYCLFTLIKL
jgi:hypothetical protein